MSKHCVFCKTHHSPDYKDVEILSRYLDNKFRIKNASKTGTCPSHQRALRKAIIGAREMALLPYIHYH